MRRLFAILLLLASPALAQQKFSLFDRAVARTGSTDLTGGLIYVIDSSGNLSALGGGTAGYVLRTDGPGSVPTWGPTAALVTSVRQDEFIGDGSTTDFTLTGTPITNGMVFVSLNGLPQPTSAWTQTGTTLSMGTAPISGAQIDVGYFTASAAGVTHIQEDFTASGSTTDFTLAHTPAVGNIQFVSIRGLVQPGTSWVIIGANVLRLAAMPLSGDVITISYAY